MEIGPGTHFALTPKRVDDGQWHHLVMTFHGTDEIIYVDGVPQGNFHWNQPGRVGATDFNLVIGCNRSNLDKSEDDLGVSFRGMIGQPMMWNRALSPQRSRVPLQLAERSGFAGGGKLKQVMNRKQFLKNCACGFCGCAAFGLTTPVTSAAAETNPPDDSRLGFVRERYEKLMEILS